MRTTLSQYLSRHENTAPGVTAVVEAIARACLGIVEALRQPAKSPSAAGDRNVQGEVQKPMDLLSNDLFVEALRPLEVVSWLVSEEVAEPISAHAAGSLAVLFDPLDGSSNLDVNVTVGSIFSIIPCRSSADLLQSGDRQVAAGFVAYGPSTVLVLALGGATATFVLEPAGFTLVDPAVQIPARAPEFAINTARERFWLEPTRRYVANCVAGEDGPLGIRYNMRWVGSMVADVLRILVRGGIFLYPVDSETSTKGGRLRLLYEVNPMAFVVASAGGLAICESVPALEVSPTSIHQRISVALGSLEEVLIYGRHLSGAID